SGTLRPPARSPCGCSSRSDPTRQSARGAACPTPGGTSSARRGPSPDRIAILEDDEMTILDDVVGVLVETGPTFQQVGEGRVAPLHGMHEVRVRLEAHVDVLRVDSNILDRPAIPADLPGHDPHPNAAGGLN